MKTMRVWTWRSWQRSASKPARTKDRGTDSVGGQHRAAGRPVLGRPGRYAAGPGRCFRCSTRARWTVAASEIVAAKLRRAPYATRFAELFGAEVFEGPRLVVSEAMFAVARYQIEEPSFHPYTSKFDYWLEGKARFTQQEMRGYRLFNDPDKANCGGCHLGSVVGQTACRRDHRPPVRGARCATQRRRSRGKPRIPAYFDLGVCGPNRTDIAERNAILRHVPDADAAQHRDASSLLPQRRISQRCRRCMDF